MLMRIKMTRGRTHREAVDSHARHHFRHFRPVEAHFMQPEMGEYALFVHFLRDRSEAGSWGVIVVSLYA